MNSVLTRSDTLSVICCICKKPVTCDDAECPEYRTQLTIQRATIKVEDLGNINEQEKTAAVGYCSNACLNDPKVEARMRQQIGILQKKLGIRLEDGTHSDT